MTPQSKIEMIIEQLEIDPILDISAACQKLGLTKNWFFQYVRQNKALAARWSAIKEKRGCSPRVDRSWRAYQRRKKSGAGIVHKKPAPL